MIHIIEEYPNNKTTVIRLDGILDRSSLSDFKAILLGHLNNRQKITLDLDQLSYIDREGRSFLKQFKDNITFVNIDEFLKLEFQD